MMKARKLMVEGRERLNVSLTERRTRSQVRVLNAD
jgi:hypothetical protein